MFGVNVIYWDQWSFLADPLSHWYNGSLSFQDLFAQHNEHRIFFPRIVMIGIAAVTSYNNLAEMVCIYTLLLINLILIYEIYQIGTQWSWKSLMFFIPVAWLIFSLHQCASLLTGFQISSFLCVTGFLITILFLDRSKGLDWYFAGAILGGILSSFSFMTGLLVWPVGFLFIILKDWKINRHLLVWLSMSLLTFITFFIDYTWPGGHSSAVFSILAKPFDAMSYFLVCNGGALDFYFWASPFNVYDWAILTGITGGLLLLMITGFVLYRAFQIGIIRKNAHYMAFIFFALLSECMLTFGRGSLGVYQATADRYVTFTVLGIIGVYCILIQIQQSCNTDIWSKRIFYLLCIMLLFGVVIGTIDGIMQGQIIKKQRDEMREILLSFETAPDSAISTLFPVPQFVRIWAPFLKQHQLNVFAGG
jgi:hypothetical protein